MNIAIYKYKYIQGYKNKADNFKLPDFIQALN